MKNVTYKMVGSILEIRVDTSARLGQSKSGKSESVATTEGNVDLGNGLYLGLNVYKSIPKEQWTEEMIVAAFKAKLARKQKATA